MFSGNFAGMTTSTPFRDLLHAANLRNGTDGFNSPPKEGVLRIFSPLKIRRLRSGLNPRTRVLEASTLPLDHPVPTYNFTACVVLGDKVDSAQTALTKLNLHVPLSYLQSSSKTGNSTNFSFIAFSEATFYSYSDFCNNLISSSLSSAKIEDRDVIGRAFGDCLELT